MYLLIGNKKNIGVELNLTEITHNKAYRGYGKIWLNNNFLGTNEELIYISYLIGDLEGFLNSKELDSNFLFSSINEFYLKVFEYENLPVDDAQLISNPPDYCHSRSPFTDCYFVAAFKKGNLITVTWKLDKNYVQGYSDLEQQSDEIFNHTFDINDLIEIINYLNWIAEKANYEAFNKTKYFAH